MLIRFRVLFLIPVICSMHAVAETVIIYAAKPEFNLSKTQSMWDYVVSRCLQRTLVKLNRFGEIQGDIADSWEVSRRKKEIKFSTKHLSFSDAEPMTAQDVKYSLESALRSDSDVAIRLRSIIRKVATSRHQVVLQLNKNYGPIMKALSSIDMAIKPRRFSRTKPWIGLGKYQLKSITNIKSDNVVKVKLVSRDLKRHLDIIYTKNIEFIKKQLVSGLVQAVFGIPNHMFTKMGKHSPLKEVYLNNLTFSIFLVNPSRRFASSRYFRMRVAAAILKSTKEFDDQIRDPQFSRLDCILPLGVLGTFCPKMKSFPEPENKWRGPLRIAYPARWWPPKYKKFLLNGLRPFIPRVKIIEFKSGKSFSFDSVDIFPSDYILPNADPDFAIPAFDTSPFGIKPSKSFDALKVLSGRLNSGTEHNRLDAYAKAFQKFVNEGWAIPLFTQRIPVLVSDKLQLGEAKYQFESLLCQ